MQLNSQENNNIELNLHYDEEPEHKNGYIKMPKRYIRNKNCKLLFFIIFMFIGIGLVGVLIYLLKD